MRITTHARQFATAARLAWAGAVLGGSLALAVLSVAVPAPAAAGPLDALGACMTKEECLQEGAPGVSAGAGQGICNAKYCFVTDVDKDCPGNTGLCYTAPPKVTFSALGATLDLGQFIQYAYDWGFTGGLVLATFMIMLGGIQWLTAGTSDRVSAAQKHIKDAIVGVVLLSLAYLMLQTVNPATLNLTPPQIPIVKRQYFAACLPLEHCRKCGETFGVKLPADGKPPTEGANCATYVVAAGAGDFDCVGSGCGRSVGGTCKASESRCIAGGQGKQDMCGVVPAGTSPNDAKWVCASCTPSGGNCGGLSGPTDTCCGGYCGDGECTSGELGSECNNATECRSGLCATSGIAWDGWCSSGKVGMPCNGDAECGGGNKCAGDAVGDGYCMPGTKYSLCINDTDCQSGFECNLEDELGFSGVCMPPNEEPVTIGSCPQDAPYRTLGELCTNGAIGTPCSFSKGGSDCAPIQYSKSGKGQCAKLSFSAANVQFGAVSVATGLAGQSVCIEGGIGSYCNDDEECAPNTFCFTESGVGVCVSGTVGSRCDTKCASGLVCDAKHNCVDPKDQ